jgi:hypothetical protein
MLSSAGRAVEVVDTISAEEAERRHNTARNAVTAAREKVRAIEDTCRTINTELVRLRALREMLLFASAEKITEGGTPTDAIKELASLDVRVETHLLALTISVEWHLPLAHAGAAYANADLKDAAGILVDSRRWERMNQQSKTLDALVESEGAVELHSSRFESEGVIVNEMRLEAAAARQAMDTYLTKVGPSIHAIQERRARAHA